MLRFKITRNADGGQDWKNVSDEAPKPTNRDTKAERPKTWAALQEWEETKPERDQIWNLMTEEAIKRGEEADRAALELVMDALFEETKKYNRKEDVYALRIQDIQGFFAQS